MWKTRDLTLVIFLAVLSFVYAVTIAQFGRMITGIPGINFFFAIGHALFISFGLLIYGGRRWRFLLQGILVAFLFIPTYAAGTPFDVLARIPIIVNAFFGDVIFNSVYGFFEKRNKLILWVLLVTPIYMVMTPFLVAINMILFYPPELTETFVNVVQLLLPVIIIESLGGAYLGYKIYRRVENVENKRSFQV